MSDRFHPTPRLRFVERPDENASMYYPASLRLLQQQWQHEETGVTQWRDVPLETED